jgi:hypothetical protein
VNVNRARFERCWRAASSNGTPLVQSLVRTPFSAVIDVVSAIRHNFFPILKLGTSAFGFGVFISSYTSQLVPLYELEITECDFKPEGEK